MLRQGENKAICVINISKILDDISETMDIFPSPFWSPGIEIMLQIQAEGERKKPEPCLRKSTPAILTLKGKVDVEKKNMTSSLPKI